MHFRSEEDLSRPSGARRRAALEHVLGVRGALAALGPLLAILALVRLGRFGRFGRYGRRAARAARRRCRGALRLVGRVVDPDVEVVVARHGRRVA